MHSQESSQATTTSPRAVCLITATKHAVEGLPRHVDRGSEHLPASRSTQHAAQRRKHNHSRTWTAQQSRPRWRAPSSLRMPKALLFRAARWHTSPTAAVRFPAITCRRLLTARRAHAHHDRERTQTDIPILSRDTAKHIREAECHRSDVQERFRQPARRLAAPAVSMSTVSEYHDRHRPRRAY